MRIYNSFIYGCKNLRPLVKSHFLVLMKVLKNNLKIDFLKISDITIFEAG